MRKQYLIDEIFKINSKTTLNDRAFNTDSYVVKAPRKFIDEFQEEIAREIHEAGLVIVGIGSQVGFDNFTTYTIPYVGKILLEENKDFSITKID